MTARFLKRFFEGVLRPRYKTYCLSNPDVLLMA